MRDAGGKSGATAEAAARRGIVRHLYVDIGSREDVILGIRLRVESSVVGFARPDCRARFGDPGLHHRLLTRRYDTRRAIRSRRKDLGCVVALRAMERGREGEREQGSEAAGMTDKTWRKGVVNSALGCDFVDRLGKQRFGIFSRGELTRALLSSRWMITA